jgi:signal transduction histidine kinase/CheY-like chemotaxis protein
MRFLPAVRYGTDGYPEKIARPLRTFNLVVWIVAIVAAGFAAVQFLDPRPGVWKVAVLNGFAVPAYAALPVLHRLGPIWAPLTGILLAQAHLFALACLVGTGFGVHMYYVVSAGIAVLCFGTRRVLPILLGTLALLLVVIVEVLVPYDTGLLSPAMLLGSFVAASVASFTILMASVLYLREQAERAEENLARQHELTQDKARQLEIANRYKSHFLASASHDLRQPLHALNLFVAQMMGEPDAAERSRLVGRIDAAVGAMNELFEALLDMTKLEAGILEPNFAKFPVSRPLERVETTFAGAARKKGLRLRVVHSGAWVASDPILLERILLNLVSNAVRYTERGGVVVGCRRRGNALRIDVCDTGAGIPEGERQHIFGEFYQLAGTDRARSGGLGLGLAIVDRLGRLLGHSVELDSRPGYGSRFSISVPLATRPRMASETEVPSSAIADPARGKRVIVIDDDALVLEGMRGILESWGCQVDTAASGDAALAALEHGGRAPDLIISDARLADGETGIEAIERLRTAARSPIPAFVITGDTAPERLREASAAGFHLLQKPVSPMTLRTTLNRLLKAYDGRLHNTAGLADGA